MGVNSTPRQKMYPRRGARPVTPRTDRAADNALGDQLIGQQPARPAPRRAPTSAFTY